MRFDHIARCVINANDRYSGIRVDSLAKFLPDSTLLNGSGSGGGLSPLGSSPFPDLRIAESIRRGKESKISMYPSIHVKKAALLLVVPLVCFGLLLEAQAVVPLPDGGYPNFNTAEGQKALFSLTTGVGNTAVGALSLLSNTEGSFNTATGAGTLLFNTADQNTAFGGGALLFNTTGRDNTAVGAAALLNNTEGDFNTAIGDVALHNNTTGGFNTAIGVNALLPTSAAAATRPLVPWHSLSAAPATLTRPLVQARSTAAVTSIRL